MPFIAAAAVGAVGAIAGGVIASSGAQSAANTQANAAQDANATQIYMQNQAIAEQNAMLGTEAQLLQPQREAGNYATQALQYALGLPQTTLSPVSLPGGGNIIGGTSALNFGGATAQPGGGLGPQITPNNNLGPGIQAGNPASSYSTFTGITPGSNSAAQLGLVPVGNGPGTGTPGTMGQGGTGTATAPGTGISSLFQPFSYSAGQYQQSPGFQFTLGQGLQAIQNQASATGMTLSPNTLKDLSGYAEGLANQDYQQSYQNAYNAYTLNQSNMLNALGGMAGYGNTAATNLGSAAGSTGANIAGTISNTANNISANQIGAGNAIAAGQVGSANALSGGLGNLANTYTQTALINQFLNPSSGTAGYNFTLPNTGGSGVQYGLGSGLNYNLNQ